MSDKLIRSTENTQYYFIDGANRGIDLDELFPASLPGFWQCRGKDGVTYVVHYSFIRTRDLRFDATA